MLFLSFIFCVSQWNAMNLSDYESLSDPLMSAPFEPNSRNIIKMKGTEAIFNFFFYFFIPTVLRGIQSTVIPAKPYTAPLPHGGFLPKSKYYFLQMASYFCTAMMALSWGGIHLPDVTTSSALFVYSSVMFNKPAPPSTAATFLSFMCVMGIWQSHWTLWLLKKNPFKQTCEYPDAWINFVWLRRRLYHLQFFAPEPVQLDRGATSK